MVVVPEPPAVMTIPVHPYALVTTTFSDSSRHMLSMTESHMAAYAERASADFLALDWPGHHKWAVSSKFGAHRALEHYDRIAYVDPDTLLRHTSLSVFDECRGDEFGAVDVMQDLLLSNREIIYEYVAFRESNGFKNVEVPWYFDTRLMVIPREYADIIKAPSLPIAANRRNERHLINSRILDAYADGLIKVRLLDRRCSWRVRSDKMLSSIPREAIVQHSNKDAEEGTEELTQIINTMKAAPDVNWAPPSVLGYVFDRTYADLRHVRIIHKDLMTGRFKKVLEIGSYHGFSTCAFLDALKHGKIEEFHICEILIQPRLIAAIDHYGLSDRVVIHQVLSVDLLKDGGDWDMIFVDGDHTFDNVKREAELILEMGTRVVYAHDTSADSFEPWTSLGTTKGPRELARLFRADDRYVCAEDNKFRDGELTERGMFRATMVQPGRQNKNTLPQFPL